MTDTRDEGTHWASCWRSHGHHGCAIARVERLEKALEQIALGDGVYGAQAHEYKQIARAALHGQAPKEGAGDE